MDQLVPLVRGFSFGRMTYENGGVFGPIQRPYLAVILMESGSCVMRAGARALTVPAGQAGILAGHDRFEFAYERGTASTVTWCEGFLPEMSRAQLDSASEPVGTVAVTADMTDLAGLGLRTGHVSSVDANAYRDALGLGLCRLVLLESRSRAADQRIPARILQAKRILDENLGQDSLTIEAVAARVGFTPQHLNSAFRRAIGMTPGRYLWTARAGRARQLLVHTPLPLTQICFDCGYKSLAHFSRSIRHAFGLPPARLRATRGYAPSSDTEPSVQDLLF